MSGLQMLNTKNLIDRLGDLDEEITRVCRTGEAVAKAAPKGHADEVSRLKTAMAAAQDCQEHVRCGKEALLKFDGLLGALRPGIRDSLMHPQDGGRAVRYFDQLGRKAGPAIEHHVGGLAEEATEAIGRVRASLKALRVAEEMDARKEDAKLSCRALEKTLSAAEKAIEKALKSLGNSESLPPRHEERHEEEPEEIEVEEAEVEEPGEVEEVEGAEAMKMAHGYNLTAKGLPPEFLENIQKKKDEAKGKKDEDEEKGSDKKADSLTPGNESKGPKEEGEEDMGWEPGHRTEGDKEKESAKKKADSKDPDPSMDEDLPGEDTDGVPVVDKSAAGHGYHLYEPSEHGYDLSA